MGNQTHYRPEPFTHGKRRLDGLGALLGRMVKINSILEDQVNRTRMWPNSSHVIASLIHEYRQIIPMVVIHPHHRLRTQQRLKDADVFYRLMVEGDYSWLADQIAKRNVNYGQERPNSF